MTWILLLSAFMAHAQTNEPPSAPITMPTLYAAHGLVKCTYTPGEVIRCSGREGFGDSPLAPRNPRKIAINNDQVCAIDDFGLMCWGPNVQIPEDFTRDGVSVDVEMNDEQACVVTKAKREVFCWGHAPQAPPADLRGVQSLTKKGSQICAITGDQPAACWGTEEEPDDSADGSPYRPGGGWRNDPDIDPF